MSRSIDRRDFLAVAVAGMLDMGTSLAMQGTSIPRPNMPRILAIGSFGRGLFYFNPVGVYVEVRQTVQWAALARPRSVIAFHPSIDNHELRIPEEAKPFDSRTMAADHPTFEWTFDVAGTYDYYCRSAEYLGMVGRIVVGKAGGPAERPPGYGNREGRAVMYPDAARLLEYLRPTDIVQKKLIPYPMELLQRQFPWR